MPPSRQQPSGASGHRAAGGPSPASSSDWDPARVARAQQLEVVRLAPGFARVSGDGFGLYYVRTTPVPFCYCGDAAHRQVVCKHAIAAMAAETRGDTIWRRHQVDDPAESFDGLPDYLSLDAAVRMLQSSKKPSKELAARILADPEASEEQRLAAARRVRSESLGLAVLGVGQRSQDRDMRLALGEETKSVRVAKWLLSLAEEAGDPQEMRVHFRTLAALARKGGEAAIRWLEETTGSEKVLVPSDLVSLFASPDREFREFALMFLARFSDEVDRIEAELAASGRAAAPPAPRPKPRPRATAR